MKISPDPENPPPPITMQTLRYKIVSRVGLIALGGVALWFWGMWSQQKGQQKIHAACESRANPKSGSRPSNLASAQEKDECVSNP